MATSLVLESTSATGKKIRKAITDVNPNVSNANLKTFGQMANALTTNVYGSSSRVGKDELQPVAALKSYSRLAYIVPGSNTWKTVSAPLELSFSTLFGDQHKNDKNFGTIAFRLQTSGDEIIPNTDWHCELISSPNNTPVVFAPNVSNKSFDRLFFGIPANEEKFLGDYVFRIPERDGYAPFEFTIRIVADS